MKSFLLFIIIIITISIIIIIVKTGQQFIILLPIGFYIVSPYDV